MLQVPWNWYNVLWEFKGERTHIEYGRLKRALKNGYSWDVSLIRCLYDVKIHRKKAHYTKIWKWKAFIMLGEISFPIWLQDKPFILSLIFSECSPCVRHSFRNKELNNEQNRQKSHLWVYFVVMKNNRPIKMQVTE